MSALSLAIVVSMALAPVPKPLALTVADAEERITRRPSVAARMIGPLGK